MALETKIGERISSLRDARKLSRTELSERSGIPEAELQSFEEGRASPSVAPLVKISRVLGVRLGTFLDDAENSEPVVVRSGKAPETMRSPGAPSPKRGAMSFYSLGKDKADRAMEPFIVEIRPEDPSQPSSASSHEGEEFVYILSGAVKLHYGDRVIELAEGDSVYYDSLVAHFFSSSSIARVLAVVYAPF